MNARIPADDFGRPPATWPPQAWASWKLSRYLNTAVGDGTTRRRANTTIPAPPVALRPAVCPLHPVRLPSKAAPCPDPRPSPATAGHPPNSIPARNFNNSFCSACSSDTSDIRLLGCTARPSTPGSAVSLTPTCRRTDSPNRATAAKSRYAGRPDNARHACGLVLSSRHRGQVVAGKDNADVCSIMTAPRW